MIVDNINFYLVGVYVLTLRVTKHFNIMLRKPSSIQMMGSELIQ